MSPAAKVTETVEAAEKEVLPKSGDRRVCGLGVRKISVRLSQQCGELSPDRFGGREFFPCVTCVTGVLLHCRMPVIFVFQNFYILKGKTP